MMKDNKFKLIIALVFTGVLATIALGTVVLLKSRGTRPVAPSVPESRPKAAEEEILDPFLSITPVASCKSNLSVACQAPPIPVPTVPQSHSPLDISWSCDLTKADCFTLLVYKYGAAGSGTCGRSCGEPSGNVAVESLNLEKKQITESNGVCRYTYHLTGDVECLRFGVIAKDLAGGIACNDCTGETADYKKCCPTKPQPVTICGLPAQPQDPLEVPFKEGVSGGVKITWYDNSTVEQGFRIYRRPSSSGSLDGFDNILPNEQPLGRRLSVGEEVEGKGNRNWIDTSVTNASAFVYSVRAFTNLCEPCGATGTPTPTATPTCVKPDRATDIENSGYPNNNSQPVIKWVCGEEADCFTLRKFSSDLATASNGCTSCPGPERKQEGTAFNVCTGDAHFTRKNGICTFTDTTQLLTDFKCLSYEITNKDYVLGTATFTCEQCKENCVENNNTTCCFSDMASIDICGVPADPISLTKEVNQPTSGNIRLTWVDNSEEEQGFKIYRRVSSSDNFLVEVGEVPIKVLETPSPGKGVTIQFVDGPSAGTNFNPSLINAYFYSVRAYTYLCSCPGGTTPTPTATRTPTPTATSTPSPGQVSCDRLEIAKIKKAGESTWRNWQNGMVVGLNDKIKLRVTFSGTVDRVAVRVMVDGVKLGDYYSPLGRSQTGSWETSEGDDAVEISRSGDWEITAFVKSAGFWQ